MKIVQFVTDNWVELCAAASGIVVVARIIVKLTPTPKDDTFLEKFVNFFKNLGLVIKDPPKK